MRAPAVGLGDVPDFFLHLVGVQGFGHVEVEVLEFADGGTDFTGAELAVVVNDGAGDAGGARHGPLLRALDAFLVQLEMELDAAQ